MEIVPGEGWEELLDALFEEGGTAMFLGAGDVGKSTLVRWLAERLVARGRAFALVDADVGQSALCLPGTVGMKLFREGEALQPFRCDRFTFLGSPNPARILLSLVESAGWFVREARRQSDLQLVDTTGLVTGGLGTGLKLAKIRETGAGRVVAIQREEECEPILERLREVVIHRLAPSPAAAARGQEARARRRAEKLAAYFAQATTESIIHGSEARFFLFGREASLRNTNLEAGKIIGLNRGKETLALGFVSEADGESITLATPLRTLQGVNRVILGEITLED